MSRMNTIADAMSTIKNAVDTGRRMCVVQPASKLVGSILSIMKEHGYISGFEYVEDGRGGHFVVGLKGSINRCGAITPRFSVTLDELEEWETRYLPGKNFGILVITTSKGVMSHRRAREIGVGGELLAFVY